MRPTRRRFGFGAASLRAKSPESDSYLLCLPSPGRPRRRSRTATARHKPPVNLQVSQSDWWKSHALDKNGIRAPRRAASSKYQKPRAPAPRALRSRSLLNSRRKQKCFQFFIFVDFTLSFFYYYFCFLPLLKLIITRSKRPAGSHRNAFIEMAESSRRETFSPATLINKPGTLMKINTSFVKSTLGDCSQVLSLVPVN